MAEKTEQKPKRTRNTKKNLETPITLVDSNEEIAPKEEVVPKEGIASPETVITPEDAAIKTEEEILNKEEIAEITEEIPEEDEEISEKEIAKEEETSENAGELASGEEVPEEIPEKMEEIAPNEEIGIQLPEIPETVIAAIRKQEEEKFPKDAKVVLKKLNPNFADAKSKWAAAVVRGSDLHIFFKGSFGKAHKRAENCCLLHRIDPKTIQLIRK